MVTILIILFVVSLVYVSMADRLSTFVTILGLQGVLLFGIATLELRDIDVLNLSFILAETLFFKGIVIPIFLRRTLRRNSLTKEAEPTVTHFASLIFVTSIILASFLLAYTVHEQHLRIGYFTASLSALFTGLFIIMARTKIITHVMGYLLLENGIFLLSLAVGNEMPLAVNTAILLDLLSSVLLLAFLVDKVGESFQTVDASELNELND